MDGHELVIHSAFAAGPPAPGGALSLEGGRVSGLATLWDVVSADMGGWRDRFARGSLQIGEDAVALLSHDTAVILGRTSAGTLRLSETVEGLAFSLDLPDTQAGRDVLTSLRRVDLHQCSTGSIPLLEDWEYDRVLGAPVRTFLRSELIEVSLVPMPAFAGTSARVET